MEITNEQKQLMLSGLLGDGSIKHSHISYNCMYREYMAYKRNLAGRLAKSEVIESDNLGYKKGSKIYTFSMKINDYSRDLVSKPLSETIKDLDELGLALWILDDGSLHRKNYFYNINTHSFTREEEENILIPKLNEFGIYPSILTEKKKDGRMFSYLYVSKWNGAMVISRIIREYMVDCYKYKLIPYEIEDAYFKLDLNVFNNLETEHKRTAYFLKQNNCKKMSDMLTNNTKGKEYTWNELEELWYKTFPETGIVFEMWDFKQTKEGEDESILIPQVNFLDENPIVKGSYKLSFNTWKPENNFMYIEGRSLTWKELIRILDKHNDKHHIFLELVEVKNNNEVFVFLGS
jgi:hypothetical protein